MSANVFTCSRVQPHALFHSEFILKWYKRERDFDPCSIDMGEPQV